MTPTYGSGAATLNYKPPYPGAVNGNTVESKLMEIVSIEDFGGIGDDSTDNTDAINKAQNYLLSLPSQGGIIYFPGARPANPATGAAATAGVYVVNSAITQANRVTWLGSNSSSVTIRMGPSFPTNTPLITAGNLSVSPEGIYHVRIEHMTLDCSGLAQWYPDTSYALNATIIDGNGHEQKATTAGISQPTTLVNAGSFVTGQAYRISSVGTTNFTLIGASANIAGVVFVATGAGSGTGTANTAGPVFSATGGTVTDGSVVWTDQGFASGIAGSVGYYSQCLNETCGLRGVWILNWKSIGLHLQGGFCQNFKTFDVQIVPLQGYANSAQIGAFFDGVASCNGVWGGTFQGSGNGTQVGTAIKISNCAVDLYDVHVERAQDGVLIDSAQSVICGIQAHSTVNTVIHVLPTSSGSNCIVKNETLNGGTWDLDDERFFGLTGANKYNGGNICSYENGWLTDVQGRRWFGGFDTTVSPLMLEAQLPVMRLRRRGTGISNPVDVDLAIATPGGVAECQLNVTDGSGNPLPLFITQEGGNVPLFVSPPTHYTDPGVAGQIAINGTTFYWCHTTNTWAKVTADSVPW